MSTLKKTAIVITIITLISKLIGFGREIVLAYFFGTSFVVDSYLMASAIPMILFGWLTSISLSFTPIYTSIRERLGEEKSKIFTNSIMSLTFLVAFICILLGLIFNNQIVSISAPGFKGKVFDLTSSYLKVSIWVTLFIAPIQILTSFLNCNNKFIQSNIATLVISSTQVIFIFMAGIFNNSILIYGIILSNILHFVLVYAFSKKIDFRLKFKFVITPEIKQAFIIVIPIFISSMIEQINTLVDKSFASGLLEGSIASLNYGYVFRTFIFTVFSVAITTMIYPMLSQAIAKKDIENVKNLFSNAINIIIILFVPITIGAIILATPAISFAFERGEFVNSSTIMTTSAFIMYSIGLLPIALRDVITKVFYSMQDTKSTLYIGMFTVLLNIIFNIILIKSMGHSGLALATSLSSIISIPLFFIVLRKKIGALGLKNTSILFLKSCIATAFMGVVVYFGFNYLSSFLGSGKINTLLSIILSTGIGGIIYFTLMIILKVKEMDFFTDIIKKVVSKLAIRG